MDVVQEHDALTQLQPRDWRSYNHETDPRFLLGRHSTSSLQKIPSITCSEQVKHWSNSVFALSCLFRVCPERAFSNDVFLISLLISRKEFGAAAEELKKERKTLQAKNCSSFFSYVDLSFSCSHSNQSIEYNLFCGLKNIQKMWSKSDTYQ